MDKVPEGFKVFLILSTFLGSITGIFIGIGIDASTKINIIKECFIVGSLSFFWMPPMYCVSTWIYKKIFAGRLIKFFYWWWKFWGME